MHHNFITIWRSVLIVIFNQTRAKVKVEVNVQLSLCLIKKCGKTANGRVRVKLRELLNLATDGVQ